MHIKDNGIYFFRVESIGQFIDGWHNDGYSQAILDAYVNHNQLQDTVPCDTGHGTHIYKYTFNYNSQSVNLNMQDF